MGGSRALMIAATGLVVMASAALFGLSASQTTNTVQSTFSSDSSACTDVSKSVMAAIARPARFVSKVDYNRGNTNSFTVCSWQTVNTGVRMSASLLVLLLSIAAIWFWWSNWFTWLYPYAMLLFICGSLLMGCMVFDIADLQQSLTGFCQSSTYDSNISTCDYSVFQLTIGIEAACWAFYFALSILVFKQLGLLSKKVIDKGSAASQAPASLRSSSSGPANI